MQKLIKFIITLFCSINPYYYFRQFIFGAAISCFFVLVIGKSSFEIIIPANTSYEHINILKEHNIQIAMNGKGRSIDNIVIERFFRTLKYNCIFINDFNNVKELKESIDHYRKRLVKVL